MQELLLELKPTLFKPLALAFFAAGLSWVFVPLASGGFANLLIGVILCVSWIFYGGWHYAIGTYLLDKCRADLGFFARNYKAVYKIYSLYWLLICGVLFVVMPATLTAETGTLVNMMIYLIPIHLVAIIIGMMLIITEGRALMAVEEQVGIGGFDVKTTSKQIKSIFRAGKIQERVQAIRDKDPMRMIYSSEKPPGF